MVRICKVCTTTFLFFLNFVFWNNYRLTGGAKIVQGAMCTPQPAFPSGNVFTKIYYQNQETDSGVMCRLYSDFIRPCSCVCGSVRFITWSGPVTARPRHAASLELLHPHPVLCPGSHWSFLHLYSFVIQECHVNQHLLFYKKLMNFPDKKIKVYSVAESYEYWRNLQMLLRIQIVKDYISVISSTLKKTFLVEILFLTVFFPFFSQGIPQTFSRTCVHARKQASLCSPTR